MTAPTIDARTLDQTHTSQWTTSGQVAEIAQPQEQFTLSSGLQQSVLVSSAFIYELEQDIDGEFVASEPKTGMYGEGDSASEAVLSLLRSLAGLRAELRSYGENLSPEHAADLEFLDRILWV